MCQQVTHELVQVDITLPIYRVNEVMGFRGEQGLCDLIISGFKMIEMSPPRPHSASIIITYPSYNSNLLGHIYTHVTGHFSPPSHHVPVM